MAAQMGVDRKGGQFAPGGGRIGAGPAKEKAAKGKGGGGGGGGTGGDSAKAEKTAKRYATRAKFWNKKHAEFHAKAKAAKTEAERAAAMHAAREASKKAAQAHAKVVRSVGEHHALAQESKKHLEHVNARMSKTPGGDHKPSPKAHEKKPGPSKESDHTPKISKSSKTIQEKMVDAGVSYEDIKKFNEGEAISVEGIKKLQKSGHKWSQEENSQLLWGKKKTTTPSPSAPKLDAKAEKTAKRYAARAKFWEKKHAEFTEKAKSAKSDAERQAHLKAAQQAQKKAQLAAKKVEKVAGADHPLTQQAKASAEKTGAKVESAGSKSSGPKTLNEHMKKYGFEKGYEKYQESLGYDVVGNPLSKGSSSSGIGLKGGSGGKISDANFQDAKENFKSSLTSSEKSSCLAYSGSAYTTINGELRKSKGDLSNVSSLTKYHANALDSAIKKSPVDTDIKVYRGMNGKAHYTNLAEGQTFTDHGYGSTSIASGSAFDHKEVMMHITVPKGMYAAPIPSHFPAEKEMLLPRGTKYRIDKVEHGSKMILHVTVVAQNDHSE